MTHTYAVVIEPAGAGFAAYVPDLPGCVAAASISSVEMVSV
jgi:predicted RNase H-like HicB family nuclease